jgi:murein DD-endopeptidase MepM/ murein hydrolase activator NlpD
MKRRTILIVPPRGVPIKAFRIRLSVAFFMAGIILVGFTGLFLPFSLFTNDVTEQNQRKNLTDQNKALLQKIISTLRMLKELKAMVSSLEQQRVQVADVSGKRVEPSAKPQERIDFSQLKSDELLSYIEKMELRFSPFRSTNDDSGNCFDSIPVVPPIPSPAIVSRQFGSAIDPFSGKTRMHNGTDFIAESGTPVFATATGIVQRIEKHAIWGNKVVIQHGADFSTVYAHLGTVKTSRGKLVKRGETIGEIGLSGLTSGPHVHYEIWNKGRVVDPEKYLFPSQLFVEK